MNPDATPTCWIIAGPNGAGKTTFALRFLPEVAKCRNFVNADSIAAGLSPLAPETAIFTASRLFLKTIEQHIQNRQSFAFETTLSGRTYLQLIERLRENAWQVEIIYLALSSVEMSKMRVAERVAHGGHNIPIKDIERRFSRSLRNLLTEFSRIANRTRCLMNSNETPELVFIQDGESRIVVNQNLLDQLTQQAGL